jgi:hypothetical protein
MLATNVLSRQTTSVKLKELHAERPRISENDVLLALFISQPFTAAGGSETE